MNYENYEVDVVGINEETKDADAISFRFYSEQYKRYLVFVYDGGIQKYGEALKDILNTYYFPEGRGYIDAVICSHPDQDHASGLSIVLDNFQVGCLVMNRPWLYIDELFDHINDDRITKKSLEKRLRQNYTYINTLEEMANEKGIPIYEAFEGTKIFEQVEILSPSKEFYIEKIIESEKTPLTENAQESTTIFSWLKSVVQKVLETWTKELLKEDVSTSAENETSLVVLGTMETEMFLLTGDAGIEALDSAINYSLKQGVDLRNVQFYQIPHHGGRHNVSPSILNRLIGPKVGQTFEPTRLAFVSVGKNSDHPKQMVVNAFVRRGLKVFKTDGASFWYHKGTPDRNGYTVADTLVFSEEVEDWDD